MLRVICDNICLGVCSEPHSVGSASFEVAHVMFSDEAARGIDFTMPTVHRNGFFEQDTFDLVGEDGSVRYAGCLFYTYSVFHTKEGNTIFENAVITYEGAP